jgi:hypothetical protein
MDIGHTASSLAARAGPRGAQAHSTGARRRARACVRYWLKSRRVAGEPAGMPACSSFA